MDEQACDPQTRNLEQFDSCYEIIKQYGWMWLDVVGVGVMFIMMV
jgi:hypothetical protein